MSGPFPKFIVEEYEDAESMEHRINALFASNPMYRVHLLSESRSRSRTNYTAVYVRVGELDNKR